MRYKNKYFREALEKDLPPYPITEDSFTNSYADQLLREDYDTERIVKAVKIVAKEYSINIDLDKALYGDNIRIKLKVDDE